MMRNTHHLLRYSKAVTYLSTFFKSIFYSSMLNELIAHNMHWCLMFRLGVVMKGIYFGGKIYSPKLFSVCRNIVLRIILKVHSSNTQMEILPEIEQIKCRHIVLIMVLFGCLAIFYITILFHIFYPPMVFWTYTVIHGFVL